MNNPLEQITKAQSQILQDVMITNWKTSLILEIINVKGNVETKLKDIKNLAHSIKNATEKYTL